MKKTAKNLFATVLFLTGFTFADMMPIGFSCQVLPGDVAEVLCTVAQEAPDVRLNTNTYDVYDSWNSFEKALVAWIEYNVQPSTGNIYIEFETDIDLGGVSGNGDKCNNEDFTPMDLSSISAAGEFYIDGKGHSVKGLCYIAEDENASFFGSLSNAFVSNFIFDDAYVMAKTVSAQTLQSAAVVAYAVQDVEFENVTVTNSKVYGWSTAAVVESARGNTKFKGVQVENVLLSLSEESVKEVLENASSNSITTTVSYSGGVVAYLAGYAEFENISISNLLVPDSVAQILQRAGKTFTSAHNVGGIVGLASMIMDAGQTLFTLQGCNVSAELNGSTVGGLVGALSPYTITGRSVFNVADVNVTLKSGDYSGANQNRYVGGLFGSLSWKNGEVLLSKNKVEFSVESRVAEAGSMGSHIGGLVGVFTGLADGNNSPVDFDADGNEISMGVNTLDEYSSVGGVVGYAAINTPSSTFTIQNSAVKPINPESSLDVFVASADLKNVYAAYMVGFVQNMDGEVKILGNHAEGNIRVPATSVEQLSAVGAMAGKAECATMDMRNNTSVGNLDVAIVNGSAGTKKDFFSVGYEVGVMRASGTSATLNIIGNYHYGYNDVNAALAVGWLGLDDTELENGLSSDLWKTQSESYYRIWNNYRNAVKNGSASLEADGKLDIDGTGAIYDEDEKKWLYDGVVESDAMKSRLFTYVMNSVSAGAGNCSESDVVCWENEPDSLPKISDSRSVYKLVIDIDEIYDALADDDKALLKDYMLETKSGHHDVVTYTETYYAPSYDFISLMNSLSVASSMFESGSDAASSDIEVDPYNLYLTNNYSLKAKPVPYEMVFLDVNTANKDLFYGEGSEVSDSLMVPNSLAYVSLPSQVYTATACVAGWSFDADATDYDYHVSTSGEYLYGNINAEKTLYAVWWDAEQCAGGHYNRVRLESVHGTVAVDEYRKGTKVYTHRFAKDSTMLLPMAMLGLAEMVVHAEPDSGYAFDSLVVVLRDTFQTPVYEERFTFLDGDTLQEYLRDAVMTAYFSESKDNGGKSGDNGGNGSGDGNMELVQYLLQSGNAVCLALDAGTNVHPAEVLVTLMDAQGVVLAEDPVLLQDSVEYWMHFALKPGKYVVHSSVLGHDDVAPFDTAFTVRSEILVAKDSWRMLSLSDVDMENVDWSGDQLFYWWDESASFGDYWKYQKYQGKKAAATRGYWYNSLEGRTLPLRSDTVTNGREVEWNLDSGWTMVANPFGWAIEVDELRDDDSLAFIAWNGEYAGYGRTYYLGPYEAAWVYSGSKKTVRLEDPKPFFVSAEFETPGFDYPLEKKAVLSRASVLAKATGRENWTLQAVLSDTRGHRDDWNVMGVGAAAEMPEPPAGMGDHVNLSVVSGKKVLAKSVVAPGDSLSGYSWQVALSASSDRVGYLKFEGLADLAGYGYRAYVTYDGETREIPAGDSLRVLLKANGATATVHVTTSEIRTLASKLENLRFEHVPGALQVGFDAGEGLAGANFRVQLVDLNGKVAATYSGKSVAGRNTLALKAPKSGLYVLRVTAGGHQVARKVAISR